MITYIFFFTILGGMLGASIASFLGVVVERTKRGESIMGHSHCACGRPLKWYENVPIIGWLRIKGVTPCCKEKLPLSYLISEIGLFLLFAIPTFFILINLTKF